MNGGRNFYSFHSTKSFQYIYVFPKVDLQCIQERDPHNSAVLFSSLPDPKDRLQECWDNWWLDQFATDNRFPVCTVQKMSDNEEPPNYWGFSLVTLRLFPRDIANCFCQGEKFRKTQKRRRHLIQLRIYFFNYFCSWHSYI